MTQLPLEEGEKILLTCRKHWIVYCIDAFVLFLLFILPYIAYRLIGLSGLEIVVTGKTYHLIVFLYAGWFLLLWTYFFIVWTNVYLDAWIVTDRRIIDIEQISLFHRNVSDFRIEKIQNIMVKEVGLVAHMFGYGTIIVETAGERIELRFDTIPNPGMVRDMISECHDKCLARLSHTANPAI